MVIKKQSKRNSLRAYEDICRGKKVERMTPSRLDNSNSNPPSSTPTKHGRSPQSLHHLPSFPTLFFLPMHTLFSYILLDKMIDMINYILQ